MITSKGVQRILDYRVFKYNFGRFSNYIIKMQKSYEEYRILVKETQNHSSIKGHGMYFKHKRIKFDQWNGNYQQLWNQYFTII